jgi:hypothetical protein
MSEPVLSPGANLSSVRIRNEQGAEIGQVKEWMMDVEKGQVVYVLAEIQSNENLTAIPWEKMIAEREKGGYKLSLSEQELRTAPSVEREKLSTIVDDKTFLNKVFDSFSSKKYWDAPPSKSPGEITQRENIELSEGKGYDHPSQY